MRRWAPADAELYEQLAYASRVTAEPPYPPIDLANRVGSLTEAADPFAYYEILGRRIRAEILEALPAEWSFRGARVLDFGCGAGRTLRHFLEEAKTAEIWGCDIDARSVDWLERNLCPPLRVFRNDPTPPLPQPDAYFDLVLAVSVFSHLVETWGDWLLELRRVLRPDGLLLATFMGEGMSEVIAGEPWDEARCGMNVLGYGQPWDFGGPMVLHSPWWIREHWGRAFEVLELTPSGFATDDSEGQGLAVLRRNAREASREQLERTDPHDPRELRALQHHVVQLRKEVSTLRGMVERERAAADQQRLRLAELEWTAQTLANSRSWRLTAPFRWIAGVARGLCARLRRGSSRRVSRLDF